MTAPADSRVAGLELQEPDRLYAEMARIRQFEDMAERLFMRNEMTGSIHLSQGQEAIPVGVCAVLEDFDLIAATYRGHGACLAKGSDMTALFAELLGRESGICGGRAGSMNIVDLERGVIGCFSIVGGSIAAGTGAALALQLRNSEALAVAFFGDGAVNQAYFHECLNFAAVRKLPIVYVCENNQYGEFTPWASVTAGAGIASRGAAYGLPFADVDGNDVFAVMGAVAEAVGRAREGGGPTLVECQTYRYKGHSRHDDPRRYRPPGELEEWLERDPLRTLARRLDPNVVAEIDEAVRTEVEAALAAALAGPMADPRTLVGATKEENA